MLISVKVIPGAKKGNIELLGKDDIGRDFYKVKISAKAVDGKANKALIGFLADYFEVSKRKVTIVKGEKSRTKVIEIKT